MEKNIIVKSQKKGGENKEKKPELYRGYCFNSPFCEPEVCRCKKFAESMEGNDF